MKEKGIDYFENSRRATYSQQSYGRENPRGFRGYSGDVWGVTASDGPGIRRFRLTVKKGSLSDTAAGACR